jgi:hypothetical protein
MPLTKVTSSLINTISASQIQAEGATAGQVLTYNGTAWNAAAAASAFTAAKLASPGYVRFSNGLIMQWGNGLCSGGNGQLNVTFPIAFTSATLFYFGATSTLTM